jgi:hypothetical protein
MVSFWLRSAGLAVQKKLLSLIRAAAWKYVLTLLEDVYAVQATEYTECWPCPLFDILLKRYYSAG